MALTGDLFSHTTLKYSLAGTSILRGRGELRHKETKYLSQHPTANLQGLKLGLLAARQMPYPEDHPSLPGFLFLLAPRQSVQHMGWQSGSQRWRWDVYVVAAPCCSWQGGFLFNGGAETAFSRGPLAVCSVGALLLCRGARITKIKGCSR